MLFFADYVIESLFGDPLCVNAQVVARYFVKSAWKNGIPKIKPENALVVINAKSHI